MKSIRASREISRDIPREIPFPITDGTIPLLTAYGCVLIERYTGKTYIYTAVNLKTGRRDMIDRRSTPLLTSGVETMVEKLSQSHVAGAARLDADRQLCDRADLEGCQEMLRHVFSDVLPEEGYATRESQMELAELMLSTVGNRKILLAEAAVGIGKTIAYLAAAIIAKRTKLGGYCNMSYFTGTPYVELSNMPIVIATSSIALQKALIAEHIPELSRILIKHDVIKKPIVAVLRKGREHYVCEYKLRSYMSYENSIETMEKLESLLKPTAPIDMAEIDWLNAYMKRRIGVPDRCVKNCPYRETCAYLEFRRLAQSPEIDIQVCNHNYLLADAARRREGAPPLIQNYQMIIIDEAHRFLAAARSMYGIEFSGRTLMNIRESINALKYTCRAMKDLASEKAKKLFHANCNLFRRLMMHPATGDDNGEDIPERFTAFFDKSAERHLRSIRDLSDRLIEIIGSETISSYGTGRREQILWELEQVRSQADAFMKHDGLICWLECNSSEIKLGAIPKNLATCLYDDIWSKGIPTILTSGTLSAAGNFDRTKRSLGIHLLNPYRVMETSNPSPFDYKKNCLLYISEGMPYPDWRNPEYIKAIAHEIKRLVLVSNGHAAVLFTSYLVMDMVWGIIAKNKFRFPLFKLGKGSISEITRYKQSGNGVLFAAGAMWEGIDIPGDTLSMLVIPKLPFPVPDPISEFEQTQYDSHEDFKESYIKPEMLIRYTQGRGRGHRTEADTCVIALCDSRASKDAPYRKYILEGTPDCPVTSQIEDVVRFYYMKKSKDYFS